MAEVDNENHLADLEGHCKSVQSVSRSVGRTVSPVVSADASFVVFREVYGSDLLLIDIEENRYSHFGYRDEGTAYTNLTVAQAFLSANGVPRGKVKTWNPDTQDLYGDVPADLAVSLLSSGFHYPADMYMPYFRFGVSRRGGIVPDLRNGRLVQARKRLASLGRLTVLSRNNQFRRVLITRKGRK